MCLNKLRASNTTAANLSDRISMAWSMQFRDIFWYSLGAYAIKNEIIAAKFS